MKFKLLLVFVVFSPISLAADSCSPQQQHQSKYEKYVMEDVPSLLESCGLGLSIKIPSFSVPSLGDLFCGYSAGDLADWYTSNSSLSKSRSTNSSYSKISAANASAASSYRKNNATRPTLSTALPPSSQIKEDGESAIRDLQSLSEESESNSQNSTSNTQQQWEPASLFKKQ